MSITSVTTWTVAHSDPPSMGISRQECWSGLPCPSPGHLLDPGIEPGPPALQVGPLPPSHQERPAAGKVVHLLKNFPTLVIHNKLQFSIVSEAKVNVFLEFP